MDINTEFPGVLPENLALITALHNGAIELEGQFLNSSNYTFLCKLTHETNLYRIVYKPRKGEQPLWDFPVGTLTKREAAAFLVSEWLGWSLVPACLYRTRKTPLGAGSVQIYMEHDLEQHYFNFTESQKHSLQPLALFDLIINNADRKGGHIFFDEKQHLWAIDHGLCFHVENKLRTVIWDFAGMEIPPVLLQSMRQFIHGMSPDNNRYEALAGLIRVSEIRAMLKRCEHILDHPHYIFPPTDRRPYPWPPV